MANLIDERLQSIRDSFISNENGNKNNPILNKVVKNGAAPLPAIMTPKRRTKKEKFDSIIKKCPKTRRVRYFIKEWLSEISEEKNKNEMENIFGEELN